MHEKKKSIGIWCVCLAFLNIIIYCPCFLYCYIQDGDELSSIAYPMYLAGYDWSSIIANTSIWHGYGHVIFLSPFFKICNTWLEIYNVCRINSLVMWIVLSELIFLMCISLFKCNEKTSFVISVISSMGILKPDYGIGLCSMTEMPIGLIAVILVFLLLKIMNSVGIKRHILSFIMYFISLYSFTIHSRASVLLIAITITVILITMFNKKNIISIRGAVLGAVTGGITYKILDNYYIKYILTDKSGAIGKTGNNIADVASTGINRVLAIFQSKDNIITAIDMFLTHISGFTILSAGFIWAFVVAIILYIYNKIREKEKIDNLIIISIFGMTSWMIMEVLLCLRQYFSIMSGDKRWYIYLRYPIPFIIIVVIAGSMIIVKNREMVSKIFVYSSVLNIIFTMFFLIRSIELIKPNKKIMTALANIFRQFFYDGEGVNAYYYKFILIEFAVWIVAFIFIKNKKYWQPPVLYMLFSIVLLVGTYQWHYDNGILVRTETDASIKIIEKAMQDNEKIYCYQKGGRYARYLQTQCFNIEIEYFNENLWNGSGIILSSDPELLVYDDKIVCCQLDENEYLYTYNVGYAEQIMAYLETDN